MKRIILNDIADLTDLHAATTVVELFTEQHPDREAGKHVIWAFDVGAHGATERRTYRVAWTKARTIVVGRCP